MYTSLHANRPGLAQLLPGVLQVNLCKKEQSGTLSAWDTPIAAPWSKHMPQTTCNQCDAHYNSEGELRTHLRSAHRKFGMGESSSEPDDTQSSALVTPEDQPAK
jgi:hypothetical protein